MKTLVLGADGFMGKKMCLYLTKKNKLVKAFDVSEMEELRGIEGIECIQGNIQMIESMPEIFDDVDEVYHFICTTIPQEGTSQIPQEIEMNLIPLTRLLQIIHNRGIEKFVFISSAGTVYGEGDRKSVGDELKPICSYGTLKQVSEAYIELFNRIYNHRYKIARISNPYGVGQHKYKTQGIIPIFINAIKSDKAINVYGDGEVLRDYLYVEDVIEALFRVSNYEGEDEYIFNIASGVSYSINQIIRTIEEELGLTFSEINYIASRECDIEKNIVDVSATYSRLGWKATTELRDGIRETYRLMFET